MANVNTLTGAEQEVVAYSLSKMDANKKGNIIPTAKVQKKIDSGENPLFKDIPKFLD